MFHSRLLASSLLLIAAASPLCAGTVLSEDFDNIATLAGNGWTLVNNSAPLGTTGWFQGIPAIFASQSGASSSYIAANFNNAGLAGNISNWLISPVLSLQNDLTLTFFTRTEADFVVPDRLEVRLSQNGSSANVGASDSSVGDFTSLLLTINSGLTTTDYPQGWTQETINIAGLGAPITGRLAFRYNVPDTSTNADYIGIDTLQVTTSTPEPTTLGLIGFGLCAAVVSRRKSKTARS
jgi:hypothetical protein